MGVRWLCLGHVVDVRWVFPGCVMPLDSLVCECEVGVLETCGCVVSLESLVCKGHVVDVSGCEVGVSSP